MKIVQSFWTKPFLQSSDSKDNRLNGGWPERKYNYFSWTLSCLQLRKYYSEIELVTDALGKEILIDKLQLPYTRVIVDLDFLDESQTALWALGKIHAYGIQKSPFLHVDNDIFIWEPFNEKIINAGLAAQNREMSTENYMESFHFIMKNCIYLPDYFKGKEDRRFIPGANAGIIGGNNISFIHEYVSEVYSFLTENKTFIKHHLSSIPVSFFNVFFEQAIFYALAEHRNVEIIYLFPDDENTPTSIGHIHNADKNGGYVHAYAGFKRRRIVYSLLEMHLRDNYPEYYNRTMDLIHTYEL